VLYELFRIFTGNSIGGTTAQKALRIEQEISGSRNHG
jgi:hypothetical protein